MNTVQILVLKVLMFHENIELLPPCDSFDLSPGNYDPIEGIKFVPFVISIRNKIVRLEVSNEY